MRATGINSPWPLLAKKMPRAESTLDTRKVKIERLIRTRSIVADVRQITERDSRGQFTACALVELVPDHFAVRECLGVIRAGNTDRVRQGRSGRREKDGQQNRDSHPTNAG